MNTLDTVVVGAGQAGLGTSYYLRQHGLDHLVLERGRIGESWLSQRWDSFRLNTPNFMNVLPGLPYDGAEPDGFWGPDELVRYFNGYVEHFQLPVRTEVTVVSIVQADAQDGFTVKTRGGDQAEGSIQCRSIVIASGIQQKPKLPKVSSKIPGTVTQLHSADYRNPAAMPAGAIVVVGSGQSGCQIAEDLLAGGRKVYLCTSNVGRAPRRYRGRDLLEWWVDMKFLDVTLDALEDKSMSRIPQPQISGLGRYGHTVSLQYLAQQGASILGRLHDIEEDVLVLGDDAAAHVDFADKFSQKLKDDIEVYLLREGIAAPPPEDDPADLPDPRGECVSPLRRLDLREANIRGVVWATGFGGDFSWLHLPVIDPDGKPIHQEGISSIRGLYFIGFPWLNSRKSGIIYGIDEDARHIAATIAKSLM